MDGMDGTTEKLLFFLFKIDNEPAMLESYTINFVLQFPLSPL